MSNEFNNLYEFEGFVLNASERSLYQNEKLIQLPPKVFDTLQLLVSRHGETVSKQEMLDTIWQDAFVEENNLSQNISALRKVFGKENKFIETVPRKGFKFVKPVRYLAFEKREHLHKNSDNGYVVATQTKTHLVEETVIDNDVSSGSPSLPRSNQKLFFGTVLTIFLASVFGLLVYSFVGSEGESRPKTPFASFDYKELTDSGDVGSSAISPDGKFIAFVKNDPDKTLNLKSLHLMELESGNDIEIEIDGDVEPDFLQFSPNGKSIYFRSPADSTQRSKVYKISVLGGKPTMIMDRIAGTFSVGPDGKRLVYCSRGSGVGKPKIAIRDIKTGKEMLETTGSVTCAPPRFPVFSPAGDKIAFRTAERPKKYPAIGILDLQTKETEVVQNELWRIRELAWHPDGESLYVNAYMLGRQYQLWNVSVPGGELTRVTSDGDAYRSLRITEDGTKISANRLQMHSNVWVLPKGDISRAKQLTSGENEISGLTALQFTPNNDIFFTARRENAEGTWISDLEGKNQHRFGRKKVVGGQPNYAYSKRRKLIFFKNGNSIWKIKFDGSDAEELELGNASSYDQPAVSPDENWLYYVRRKKGKASIWRKSLDSDQKESYLETSDYSPEHFLTVSPDGKYLAFLYESTKEKRDTKLTSKKFRRFGFLDLKSKDLKVIEVPASGKVIRWTNGGRSFDFGGFTKSGMAIFRKNLDDDSPPRIILDLENEVIFNFDWSDDEKNLVIGRGDARMNVVVLSAAKSKD